MSEAEKTSKPGFFKSVKSEFKRSVPGRRRKIW